MSEATNVTMEDLRALVRVAGLPLDDGELEELLPLYQFLRQRVDMLHEADLATGRAGDDFSRGLEPVNAESNQSAGASTSSRGAAAAAAVGGCAGTA